MFTEKKELMFSIAPEIYQQVASALLEAIGDKEFFNGSVELDTDEFRSTLRTTLIIYRDKCTERGGGGTLGLGGGFLGLSGGVAAAPAEPPCAGAIRDIVPVWWEFSLSLPEGEAENDFSWREFKSYLV